VRRRAQSPAPTRARTPLEPRPRGTLLLLAAALLLGALLGAGCGAAGGGAPTGALDVVASTTLLADIAQNVAGDRLQVQPLIPVGTDPHAFEPTPSDLEKVAGADLVIINGAGLEGTLLSTVQNAVGGDTTIVDASAGLPTRTPRPGEPALASGEQDPRFWLHPQLVKTYVANVEQAFSEADPAGAAEHKANAAAYDKKLDALDAWIGQQVAQVPAAGRKLVTDHASLGYFADRYRFEVVGTVIPSASTGETPTARQLAELTRAIRRTGARAIFVVASDNPQLAEQIGSETGVKVVTGLLDHSLTAADGPAPTYIDMLKYDTRQIVEALK